MLAMMLAHTCATSVPVGAWRLPLIFVGAMRRHLTSFGVLRRPLTIVGPLGRQLKLKFIRISNWRLFKWKSDNWNKNIIVSIRLLSV